MHLDHSYGYKCYILLLNLLFTSRTKSFISSKQKELK
jgi:hypothetical protein